MLKPMREERILNSYFKKRYKEVPLAEMYLQTLRTCYVNTCVGIV